MAYVLLHHIVSTKKVRDVLSVALHDISNFVFDRVFVFAEMAKRYSLKTWKGMTFMTPTMHNY